MKSETKLIKIIPFLVFILISSSVFSQTLYLKKNRVETKKEKAEYYRLIDTLDNGFYLVKDYWLDSTLNMSGTYSDLKKQTREGEFIWYRKNGSVHVIRNYSNNIQNGDFKRYRAEDTLKVQGYYKDNKRDSIWQWYHSNGMLKSTGTMHLGKKNGEWQEFTIYKKDSVDTISYNYLITYSEGKKHGDYIAFFKNGNIKSCGTYADGKKYGYWEKFYNEIKVVKTNNKKDTILNKTYPPGYLLEQAGYYKNDKRDSIWYFYRTDSTISSTGNYYKDKKTGEWKYYKDSCKLGGTVNHIKKRSGNFMLEYADNNIYKGGYEKNKLIDTLLIFRGDSSLLTKTYYLNGFKSVFSIQFDSNEIPIDTLNLPSKNKVMKSKHRTVVYPNKITLGLAGPLRRGFRRLETGSKHTPTIIAKSYFLSSKFPFMQFYTNNYQMVSLENNFVYHPPKTIDNIDSLLLFQKRVKEEIKLLLDINLDLPIGIFIINDSIHNNYYVNLWATPFLSESIKKDSTYEKTRTELLGIYIHELIESQLAFNYKISDQNTRWFRDGLAEYCTYRVMQNLYPNSDTILFNRFNENYKKINCEAKLYTWIGTGDKRKRQGHEGGSGQYGAAFFFFYDLMKFYDDEILAKTIQQLAQTKRPKRKINSDYILAIMTELTGEDMKGRLMEY